MRIVLPALAALALSTTPAHAEDWQKLASERDVVLKDFTFADGEKLAEVKIHVTTLGTPHRDARGQIDNAVMVLHGTGGSGHQFFRPSFADELYGPGQPLDLASHYVILPDSIGHGKSSKPSDGLRMAFPKYDYADMVLGQKRMLEEGLGVHSLAAIIGTSMGCMHAFTWGTTYPGFARRLAPFACNAVEIAGRNRMWRQMSISAIKADPAFAERMGVLTATGLIVGDGLFNVAYSVVVSATDNPDALAVFGATAPLCFAYYEHPQARAVFGQDSGCKGAQS